LTRIEQPKETQIGRIAKEREMAERVEVAVVGAGQAGLATSYHLTRSGVEHVVLERGRVGETWRRRWDSFCLVTPNWTVQLPGGVYDGESPDGFMPRDELVAFVEGYAALSRAPVRTGVEVNSLAPSARRGLVVETTVGEISARSVVVATGAYQRPYRPPAASSLPEGIQQLDADDYRNVDQLPAGHVLVVGSGQTGCQIAEELVQAGRSVFLSCGRAPWAPRRIGDHDLLWWAIETGFLDTPLDTRSGPAARLAANLLATGRDGGHDLHLRTLRAAGVVLLGRFLGADGRQAHFAPDLHESVAWGDDRYRQLRELILGLVSKRGLPPPDMPDPEPFDARAPETVELDALSAVVFAGGFRPDYRRWIRAPEAFDEFGYPLQDDGSCLAVPGLFFVGVHFLRKRKSSLLYGVGEDAAIVADTIIARSRTRV
jgi:putative flavoprotein involved in K+ transport